MKNKFTTYTFTQRKGMEGLGDMEENAFTPESIAAREERIKQLKRSGEYGEEYTMSISIENHPEFDNPPMPYSESYSFAILDLSAPKKEIDPTNWSKEAREHWIAVNSAENTESWRKNSNPYDK